MYGVRVSGISLALLLFAAKRREVLSTQSTLGRCPVRSNTRTLCTYALVSLLALSPASGIAAAQTTSSSRAKADLSGIRIDNFGRLNANYYRGAQPKGRDFASLAKLGVKTVIDLQEDGDLGEATLVSGAGMKFFRIPMNTRVVPTRDQLATFLKLVNDPANQPVYVHCAGGRHRTGVMTAAYRITHDGWNADQAFKEMKQYGFGADFLHPEFKQFVYAYHVEPAAESKTIVATVVTP
jgi:tyrosine-protein phosphatase SIW14